MGIPKFEVDMNIISKIPVYPADGGYNTETFRASFDKAGLLLKEYINEILIPNLDKIVDVDALLADILDKTLTKSDKAAPASTVGNKLKELLASQAAFFTQVIKGGDFVIEADQNFEAQLITANKVRVYGGKYVVQGNLVPLNIGSYVDLDIESGAIGLYRNDLICVRYEQDADGNVTNSIVLVKGTSTQTAAVDPEVNSGDINAGGAVVHDTPIYRVKLSQTDVALENVCAVQKAIGSRTVFVSLLASGWEGEQAPFTQSVVIEGITKNDRPHWGPVYSDDHETRIAQKEAFAMVDDLETFEGTATFTCFEDKPTVDITVQLEVNC